ncbi:hypothetical protein [Tenacibaculum sp. SZ-18]|uniref:hypothetical protein n=1 Tax=Tenacibaculum sp. SZ-18 TaxID=754423 RepID=UPI0012FE14B8|nr:hypothetical protein [Tenacibaculum sp. SZ-18]
MKSKLLNDVLKYRANSDVFDLNEKRCLRKELISEIKGLIQESTDEEIVYLLVD